MQSMNHRDMRKLSGCYIWWEGRLGGEEEERGKGPNARTYLGVGGGGGKRKMFKKKRKKEKKKKRNPD